MFILTWFPHSFSFSVKIDTRGQVVDFIFSHRILMLILMGYTQDPSISKQITRNTFVIVSKQF